MEFKVEFGISSRIWNFKSNLEFEFEAKRQFDFKPNLELEFEVELQPKLEKNLPQETNTSSSHVVNITDLACDFQSTERTRK